MWLVNFDETKGKSELKREWATTGVEGEVTSHLLNFSQEQHWLKVIYKSLLDRDKSLVLFKMWKW
jgi:hypothetical protein